MEIFERYIQEKIAGRMPLATRMRPRELSEFIGQDHLLGEGKLLRRLIEEDRIVSAIFFGPSGSGKTSLVKVIGGRTASHFVAVSAVDSNVARIREIVNEAKNRLATSGNCTLLFVDEFHRFNRAQQEVLLPQIEDGLIGFIGLTTFNPFFALAPALLSRSHLFEFKPLAENELVAIMRSALKNKERGLGTYPVRRDDQVLAALARWSQGDARRALNALEQAVVGTPPGPEGRIVLTGEIIRESLQEKVIPYDRKGDEHYDTISAFIKSVRGSDPDAALYWLAKMIRGGEDPRFIARRLVILASEDVGNADPGALTLAIGCFRAVECVGMPECQLALAQATVYLAAAPKSNASYLGLKEALADIEREPIQEVPSHLKDSGSARARQLKKGDGYRYPHDYPGGWVAQEYLPRAKRYYRPSGRGYEAGIKKRLDEISRRVRPPASGGK